MFKSTFSKPKGGLVWIAKSSTFLALLARSFSPVLIFSVTLIIFLGIFASPKIADAASVYIIPDKTEVYENDFVGATVYIDANGASINNAEGNINFPADLLQVQSVINNSSIFSIWVEQPTFSNNAGQISFNGGLPNPGFSANRGAAIRVEFRAVKSGSAQLSFSSASVRANDGLGTDVTQNKTGTIINIKSRSAIDSDNSNNNPSDENTPVTLAIGVTSQDIPDAPIISSIDTPDENTWYSLSKATFTWPVPRGVTDTATLYGSLASSIPQIVYKPAISSKTLTDLKDGVWYLHVRLKNSSGWSKTAHRKIQIDSSLPKNLAVSSSVNENDQIILDISATDKTSGIKSYKINLDGTYFDGQNQTEITPDNTSAGASANSNIVLPPLKSGKHSVTVSAYDRAGNHGDKTISVDVPTVREPKITSYKSTVTKGDRIEISGNAFYPKTDVIVSVKTENSDAKTFTVTSDEKGTFNFSSDYTADTGLVTIWAETDRGNGVVSAPSEKINVLVNKTQFAQLSAKTVEILSVVIPVVILFFVLILIIYYAFYKLRRIQRALRRDFIQTEADIHKMFNAIRSDNKRTANLLTRASTRRKLTKEESAILKDLNDDIDQAEKYFDARIKKMEKEDLK